MACIEKIYSVSAVIGDGTCNANCDFCAGKYLRPQASDSDIYWKNYEAAIKLCARHGGWSLSLTGSGEPTCDPDSVTKALTIYSKCASQGAFLPNVNLFTNGILLADNNFCDKYLPIWKSLGLNNIAVSIHDLPLRSLHSKVYKVEDYPSFHSIFGNIKKHGIGARCTLLLRKGAIDDSVLFQLAISDLVKLGVKNITAWPVGNPDGSRNEFTPSFISMLDIKLFLWKNAKLCHGHAWGGAVYDLNGTIVRLTKYVTKHNPKKDFVRQLVVFQDGTVAYSWIREGALCMK